MRYLKSLCINYIITLITWNLKCKTNLKCSEYNKLHEVFILNNMCDNISFII